MEKKYQFVRTVTKFNRKMGTRIQIHASPFETKRVNLVLFA